MPTARELDPSTAIEWMETANFYVRTWYDRLMGSNRRSALDCMRTATILERLDRIIELLERER